MAPRYRPSRTDVWRDTRFAALPDEAKVLFMYVTTGPQTNRIGLHVFSPALAAEDLNWALERLLERFANLVETFRWGWDPTTRVLFLPEWWSVARPANPNVFKSCLEDLLTLPTSPLVAIFCANNKDLPANFAKLLPNVPANVSANVTPNCSTQEQEQYQEQEPPPPTPSMGQLSSHRAGWREVEEELVTRKVANAPAATATADARGLAPAAVLKLIAEWDGYGGALGPGALFQRITGQLAHWPPAAASHDRKAAGESVAAATLARRAEQESLGHATHSEAMACDERVPDLLRAIAEMDERELEELYVAVYGNRKAAAFEMGRCGAGRQPSVVQSRALVTAWCRAASTAGAVA